MLNRKIRGGSQNTTLRPGASDLRQADAGGSQLAAEGGFNSVGEGRRFLDFRRAIFTTALRSYEGVNRLIILGLTSGDAS